MSPLRCLTRVGLVAAAFLAPVGGSTARGASEPAVDRGIQFLKGQVGAQTGETALMALAMLKSDVPPTDPALTRCIEVIRQRCSSGVYVPERRGGSDIYEAAVVCLALANLDPEPRRAELEAAAQFLISRQNANGSWDYTQRTAGDCSISQYAVLGLWEAENGGVVVPPRVWDNAAQFYLSVQNTSTGSWNYHRDESATYADSLSMTAAGIGSLMICQRQLAKYRRGAGAENALLTPLIAEGQRGAGKYDVRVRNADIDQAVKHGLAWMGANFTPEGPIVGQSVYYMLYGVERVGALGDKATIGRVNWFEAGRQFILSQQRADGSWDSHHGVIPNTVWAILFITKSTAKSVRKLEIKRLGPGTLLGGRGLPSDLSNLTVAGGRVVSRPMNGAVEGMLAVLEDPRAENADSAVNGLVTRFRTEGPAVLRPHKDRLRKLLSDRDPGVRRIAAWALARTGDVDTAPMLIGALTDADEEVVRTAREGLQLLSRKIDSLGPPSPSTPEQRAEAAQRWGAWYAAIRPLGTEGQDEVADRVSKPKPAQLGAAGGPR
jgi:hypothetical protein